MKWRTTPSIDTLIGEILGCGTAPVDLAGITESASSRFTCTLTHERKESHRAYTILLAIAVIYFRPACFRVFAWAGNDRLDQHRCSYNDSFKTCSDQSRSVQRSAKLMSMIGVFRLCLVMVATESRARRCDHQGVLDTTPTANQYKPSRRRLALTRHGTGSHFVTQRPSDPRTMWPGDPVDPVTHVIYWTCIYFCSVSIWHSCAGLLTMCVSLWDWGGLFVFTTLHVAPAVWALRHVVRLRWATFSNQ